jgi:hypothetical protein
MTASLRSQVDRLYTAALRSHDTCDDPWYSCPLCPEGCSNDDKVGCTCGADDKNAELKTIYLEICKMLPGDEP